MSIVWRDKVLSSYNGNIESVVVTDAGANYPNGIFVTLGKLVEGEREVKTATKAKSGKDDVLLIATPEVMYEAGAEIDDFLNKEEGVARAFRLADGDVITLTNDLVDGTPAVGDIYVTGSGGKLVKAGSGNLEADAVTKFVVRELAGHELTRKQTATRFDVVK